MSPAAELFTALERRAERAILQELRLMSATVRRLRPALSADERDQADALLLKLERLADELLAPPARAFARPDRARA